MKFGNKIFDSIWGDPSGRNTVLTVVDDEKLGWGKMHFIMEDQMMIGHKVGLLERWQKPD
jgi:hypothetical protein